VIKPELKISGKNEGKNGKDKIASLHVVMVWRVKGRHRVTAPLILNLGTRWRCFEPHVSAVCSLSKEPAVPIQ
jgi:hypothetical protein